MKKLLTPRGYLSWSQVLLWQRSPERYIQKYVYGQDEDTNGAMEYGKKAATALENGDGGQDMLMDALVSLLPRYAKREHDMRVKLDTPHGQIDLLGKLDTFDPVSFAFREYKTGTVKWTQKKAEKHMQLHHYATMIWLEHKKIPPQVHLDWAETERVGAEIELTGMIKTFHVPMSMAMVLLYMNTVMRVAREIDARYRLELKKMA